MRTETGQLVSDQMGLNRGGSQTTLDDVRGLCTWDPPEAANPDGAIATPIDHAGMGVVGNKLGLSVNRSRSFEGKLDAKTKPKKAIELPERIDMQVTGIDFGGQRRHGLVLRGLRRPHLEQGQADPEDGQRPGRGHDGEPVARLGSRDDQC